MEMPVGHLTACKVLKMDEIKQNQSHKSRKPAKFQLWILMLPYGADIQARSLHNLCNDTCCGKTRQNWDFSSPILAHRVDENITAGIGEKYAQRIEAKKGAEKSGA